LNTKGDFCNDGLWDGDITAIYFLQPLKSAGRCTLVGMTIPANIVANSMNVHCANHRLDGGYNLIQRVTLFSR
jgi:hypothetical protein